MPDRAEVVIVGGGIMGLGLAYNLARLGKTDVVVLEQSYLCYGASGRNGGGVRAQWSSADNIELMKRSIAHCKRFAREMGINVWFRQGGYLFLTRRQEILEALEAAVALQREHGLATRMLTPPEAQAIVPELADPEILGAAFNPDDGIVFPWPFVWGYAERAQALGVRIFTHTTVEGLTVTGGRITHIHTTRGDIRPDLTVNATGAWSPRLARMAGVELPNRPYRHEILAMEPLKPWLQPMVSLLDNGLYFSQSMRGEIVGGMGDPDEPPGLNFESSFEFLQRFSRAALSLVPRLAATRVIRQWAGCYDVSPDGHPIVGEVPGVKDFIHLVGFGGHGFMMAPAVTELCARWIARGEKDPYFDTYVVDRFAGGKPGFRSESMIIG
ncbi:MAG: FAD-binding oxidoreductase [Deltaproteobacteria bacterium]|nr:MAG: FAD-binding oxidoreductase [Deltaproteobacteria bacterium]